MKQQGFSLLSVMVAASTLLGLSSLALQRLNNNSKSTKFTSDGLQTENIRSALTMRLIEPTNCLNLFSGITPFILNQSKTLSQLFYSPAKPLLQMNKPALGSSLIVKQMTLDAITTGPLSGPHTVNLTIELDKTMGGSIFPYGGATDFIQFPVEFTLNGAGAISQCSLTGANPPTAPNLGAKEFCTDELDGIFDPNTSFSFTEPACIFKKIAPTPAKYATTAANDVEVEKIYGGKKIEVLGEFYREDELGNKFKPCVDDGTDDGLNCPPPTNPTTLPNTGSPVAYQCRTQNTAGGSACFYMGYLTSCPGGPAVNFGKASVSCMSDEWLVDFEAKILSGTGAIYSIEHTYKRGLVLANTNYKELGIKYQCCKIKFQ